MATLAVAAPQPLPLPRPSSPTVAPAPASASSSTYPSQLAHNAHDAHRTSAGTAPPSPPRSRSPRQPHNDVHARSTPASPAPARTEHSNDADAEFYTIPPPDAMTTAFAALGRYEAACASLAAAARAAFADALRAGPSALEGFASSLPILPAPPVVARSTETRVGNVALPPQKAHRSAAVASTSSGTAGPFSTLTLPPPPRARPSGGYPTREREPYSPVRDHDGDYDYHLKRRRVEDEWRAREREDECRYSNAAQYFPAPAHGRSGSTSSVGYHRPHSPVPAYTSKYTLDPREHPHSPVHAHHSYSRHAQHLSGHDSRDRQHPHPQSTYSGPPRVDARELVRGQKERARRAVAAYDSYADERYLNSAYDSAAGVKRRRSDAPVPEYHRAEVDNDDIDAMLLETATDGERDSLRVPRGLPSPLSSASPPAPAPVALKPAPSALLGSGPPSRTPSAPTPRAEPEHEHEAKVFPPTNAAGERICRACGAAGRIKDGRCVEKWGPGPLGPGTVCDRCRKKMKRVERRVTGAGSLVVRNGSGSVRGGGVVYRKQPAPASPRTEQELQREDTLLINAPSCNASASPAHNGYSTLPPRASSGGGTRAPTPPYISSLSTTRDHSPAARSHKSSTYSNSRAQMQLSPRATHSQAPVSAARSTASDAEADAEDEGDAELDELMDAADAGSVMPARSRLSVGSEASAFD